MAKCITSVSVEEYRQKYSDWGDVVSLSTPEDIATFIDTFEEAKTLGYRVVKPITKNGKYIFVVSGQNTGYDLIEELNKLVKDESVVSVQNAKLLYGKDKSKGYYYETEDVTCGNDLSGLSRVSTMGYNRTVPSLEEDSSKTDILDDDEPEVATGFMDDDDYAELGIQTVQYTLTEVGSGRSIKISDPKGVILGRSSSKSDFIIESQKVSRKHARVYLSGDVCMVSDFESSNGTFIDGIRVLPLEDKELEEGSILLVGNVEFKFGK